MFCFKASSWREKLSQIIFYYDVNILISVVYEMM